MEREKKAIEWAKEEDWVWEWREKLEEVPVPHQKPEYEEEEITEKVFDEELDRHVFKKRKIRKEKPSRTYLKATWEKHFIRPKTLNEI